jgi:hypothetical protein
MRWKKCIVVVGGGITGCGGGGGCHAAAVCGGEVDDESCAHDHRTACSQCVEQSRQHY